MSKRSGQILVVAVGALPALALVVRLVTDDLGANPIEEVTHATGDWALRLLLLCLTISPLRRATGWNSLIPYRRTLGLLSFAYAVLHFSTWLALDHFFDWEGIVEDLFERPYITAGFTAFACLIPLAITSSRGWIRRLGKRWSRLHSLVYLAAVAAVVHYLWLVKADVTLPYYYAGYLAVLLGARVALRGRR